jgi:mRNA interferase YafQ
LKTRGYDLTKLRTVVARLSKRQTLESSYCDHALKGEWAGYRDCHIEPDWVLIYQRTDTELRLMATGTHSDLF